MNEIAPGIHHWLATHPNLGMSVGSYYVADAATLIDPMAPEEEGVEWFDGERRPERILLTNRHHLRDAERFAEAFGIPILCHQAGLHEFEGGPDVKPYSWGDELAPGITALKVNAICDEETSLRIDLGDGFLVTGDGLVHYRELGFAPDQLLGDDPEAIKAALRAAYRELLDEPFDSLLPVHGKPMVGGAKDALRRFLGQDSS